MRFKIKNLYQSIIILFLLIQVYSFSLSFVDNIYFLGTWQQLLIDKIYFIRNILFFLSIFLVILYRKIKLDDVFLILFISSSYFIMYIFFPQNYIYFQVIQPMIKYLIMSYVVVRAKFLEFNELKKYLIWSARLISIILIYVILKNKSFIILNSMYMEFANSFSICLGLTLYSCIIEKNIFDFFLSGTSIIFLFFYGSRGSLFTLLVLALYLIWIGIKRSKLILLIICGLIVLIILGPFILDNLFVILKNVGIESRTLEKILSGSFFISNDRIKIYKYLFEIIKENFFLGTGICGDRFYLPLKFTGLDATYAHNLIIEILLDYGVPIGIVLLLFILTVIYRYFFGEKNIKKRGLFSVFFVISFLQLMVSRSWLTEQNFFIFFALLLTYSSSNIKLKYERRKCVSKS